VVILGILSLLTVGLLRYPVDMIANITQQILR